MTDEEKQELRELKIEGYDLIQEAADEHSSYNKTIARINTRSAQISERLKELEK